MYQPAMFREDRLEVQHALIRAHPLGLLVTNGPDGPEANPIPFLLDPAASPLGTLRGHLARANGQWRGFDPEGPVLVVFQGVHHYVTPSWSETKRETGKVVPTSNYAIVQARGRARAVQDRDWLAAQVAALTASQEAGRAEPWRVTDAPAPFVATQLKAIVGVEVAITAIEGKWKMSQNRPPADRRGVVRGLEASGDPAALEVAALVRRYGEPASGKE
jgi:transcriptional regulator